MSLSLSQLLHGRQLPVMTGRMDQAPLPEGRFRVVIFRWENDTGHTPSGLQTGRSTYRDWQSARCADRLSAVVAPGRAPGLAPCSQAFPRRDTLQRLSSVGTRAPINASGGPRYRQTELAAQGGKRRFIVKGREDHRALVHDDQALSLILRARFRHPDVWSASRRQAWYTAIWAGQTSASSRGAGCSGTSALAC